MIRMALTSMALSALLLLTGTTAPLHAQHDDPNMEWVMDGPLYDRLGGEEMIMGVIDDFVASAVEEEALKTHLEGVEQEVWKETLLAQFTAVSGGEIEYDGKSFKESLGEMGIAEEAMDLVAEQLTIALEMNEAWPEDVDELLVALELKEAEMTEEEMAEEEMAEEEMDADGVSDHGEAEEGTGHDSDADDAGDEADADDGEGAGETAEAGDGGGADGEMDAEAEMDADADMNADVKTDAGADAEDAPRK